MIGLNWPEIGSKAQIFGPTRIHLIRVGTAPGASPGSQRTLTWCSWYSGGGSASMPAGYATAWLPQTVPVACLGVNHMHWPISKPQFSGDGNPIPRPAWTPDGLRWHLVNAFDYSTLNYICLAPSLSVTTVADVYASAPKAWAAFDVVALAWKDTGILFQIDATPTANARPHHNTVGYLALNANRVNPDGYLMAGGRDRSDWVRNLQANPQVTVELSGETHAGAARLLQPGTLEDRRARDLLVGKYQEGSNLDEWGRTSLPVVVEFPEIDAAGETAHNHTKGA